MAEFGVVISCLLNPEDTERTTLILDTVYDNSVSSTATMTGHPVIGGYEIADHIYNEPDTMSIRGTLSFNGSRGIKIDKEGFKFVDFQEMFENIKKNGVLCEIVKVHIVNNEEGKQDAKFKVRKNMVLQSIAWTEKINTLDFTFSFSQAMLVDVEEVAVDVDDLFAPNVTEPKTANFTDTVLFDKEKMKEAIISSMFSFKIISAEFLNYVASLRQSALVALGVALLVTVFIGSIPVAGWAVLAVSAVAVGIGKFIKGLVERTKYRIKAFELTKNKKKNEQEAKRFAEFLGEFLQNFEELNNQTKVYYVSTNNDQECLLSIKDEYYIFTFTKNNTTQSHSLVIKDLNDNIIKSLPDIAGSPESVDQCNDSNVIIHKSNTWTYLLCPDENKNDLTKYYILVSNINLKDFNVIIEKVIENTLLY